MSTDTYEHINLEAINDIADGDAEFIREIIGNYLDSVSDSLRGLEKAIKDEDAVQTAFFAHKLKGSFAFVGAERLQQLASDAEANPGATEMLLPALSEMQRNAGKAEAELQAVLAAL